MRFEEMAWEGTHENTQDGKEGCRLQLFGAEPLDGAFEVVCTVVGFCGEGPWGFVA